MVIDKKDTFLHDINLCSLSPEEVKGFLFVSIFIVFPLHSPFPPAIIHTSTEKASISYEGDSLTNTLIIIVEVIVWKPAGEMRIRAPFTYSRPDFSILRDWYTRNTV
jgi:hypothetical protein